MGVIKAGVLGLALAIPIGLLLFSSGNSSITPPNVPLGSPTSLIPPWFAFTIGCKLHELFSFLAFVTKPPDAYILDLATSYWNSEVTYALTKNGIFDCVEKETTGSMTCDKVADALELKAFVVCRYMEGGKNINLLAKDEATKQYSLTPHGALLTEHGGLSDFVLFINEETRHAWRAVSTDMIKVGGGDDGRTSGFKLATGQDVWAWFAANPADEAQFDRAMKSLSATPSGALLSDWEPPFPDSTFCDIGGGVGSMLGEVLNHYPDLKGIVFDRTQVVDRARAHIASLGLGDRAEAVGGSFFDEQLPTKLAECDVFFLRFIIHDWPDEDNVSILKNIRAVANKSSNNETKKKVVVVMDQIIDTGAPSFLETSKSLMAINMIASNPYGARERSIPENLDLFRAAGYEKLVLGDSDSDSATKFYPLRTIHSLLQVEI